MAQDKWSSETLREIWNDQDGTRYEVGPDRDSLGLVEVRERDSGGKILARITLPAKAARMLSAAIFKCSEEVEPPDEEES